MADERTAQAAPTGLSKEQRIGFFLLLIFSIMSVSLGVLQIRNTLYAPFALSNKVPGTLKDAVNSVDTLHYRDTDSDSLTDFDELYIYNTSPYLYDTYSLGMSDKEMVAKGVKPCLNGKDCANPVLAEGSAVAADASANTAATEAAIGSPPPDLAQILSNPTQIRQMLLSAGIQKAALDKIKDSDLLITVNQVLNSSSTFKNFGPGTAQLQTSTTVSR